MPDLNTSIDSPPNKIKEAFAFIRIVEICLSV